MKAKVFLVKMTAILALLAGISTAGVKYVAVVETEVDSRSGASASLTPAEVALITAELRREAVNNLPRNAYSVMTTETVYAQGGAVLEECADENCVITLGSKIGADYIVRGTISKFQTMLTLSVDIYETEDGTLVASSDPVRSEKPAELLGLAATACANMYKKFADARNPSPQTKTELRPAGQPSRRLDYYFAPKYEFPLRNSISYGVNLEGGFIWDKGTFIGIDLNLATDAYYGDMDPLMFGIGLSFGNVYDFGHRLQLVYGVSAGYWWSHDDGTEYADDSSEWNISYDFFATFVKLRWRFIELAYRGFFGYKETYRWMKNISSDSDFVGTSFSYNHQLTIGFYFATKKRAKGDSK